MVKILDGKIVRDQVALRLKREIAALSIKPTLAIIQVGDNRESNAYIRQKKLFGEKIGATVLHEQFLETASEEKIIEKINALNHDVSVRGIIIQLPLPSSLNKERLIQAIDGKKDVDGIGKGSHTPATARGVGELLDFYNITVSGKKVVVIGRSQLVGAPIAKLMEERGAEVTVCYSQTKNIPSITKNSDIVIVAIGKPKFIGPEYFSGKQIVVDVGINTIEGEKLEEEIGSRKIVGDVDFEAVHGLVSAISPVPGGVGPMTVASLFENLLGAYKNQTH